MGIVVWHSLPLIGEKVGEVRCRFAARRSPTGRPHAVETGALENDRSNYELIQNSTDFISSRSMEIS